MAETVIKVENLSKQYRLGMVGTGTLSHDINRWWHKVRGKEDPYIKIGEINDRSVKGNSDYVWALKDINFEVKQGEILGVIGKNGAGKSTLLKILSRTTLPTTGSIKIKGRVASLLEVGTGFHPELSGRENIYLNGAILGMTRHEIQRKFDEIVDFAGVERYVDTPVKRYSSGMYVRLAFAVAAHLEPEILIVDEVLAVGDAEFQKRAIGKMKDVSQGQGRTVLFVSHNMAAVQNLCNKGVLIENGRIKCISNINEVVKEYQNESTNKNSWVGVDGGSELIINSTSVKPVKGHSLLNSCSLKVEIELETFKEINDIVIGFNLVSEYGYPIARASFNEFNNLIGLNKGKFKFEFVIPEYTLAVGHYKIEFDIAIPFIKKINSSIIDLAFDLLPNGEFGNKYFIQNSPSYNSIIRPNWFNNLRTISSITHA